MRHHFIAALFVSLTVPLVTASGQESTARSRIVSVSVFKNGLALVEQEVQVPGEGTYRLDTAPNPVHGTFWIKSNWKLPMRYLTRRVRRRRKSTKTNCDKFPGLAK